jgi:mycofactocin system creatininase family protein
MVSPMRTLAPLTWVEAARSSSTIYLAVPLGSTEQHGPHLPLSTDTIIAEALAGALANTRPDVVVAPTLPYGASGEHAGFAGTLSIGLDALEAVIVELVRSADAFAGVVLVSGHGGNAAALNSATSRLGYEGRRALAWSPTAQVARQALGAGATIDSHAGRTETAVLMSIAATAVRRRLLEAGDTRPADELMPLLRSRGVAAVSPNGVLGDPVGASPEEGRRLIQAWSEDLVAAVAEWAGPPGAGPRSSHEAERS